MSQNTRKTWVSVLIASVIIVGILAVAAIGGTAFFIYRHVNTEVTANENADVQFAAGAEAVRRAAAAHRDPERRRAGAAPRRDSGLASGGKARDAARARLRHARGEACARRRFPSGSSAWRRPSTCRFSSDTGIDFDSDRVHLTAHRPRTPGPRTDPRPGRPPRLAGARLDGIGRACRRGLRSAALGPANVQRRDHG